MVRRLFFFERIATSFVDVVTAGDREAFLHEAMRERTRTAEQINHAGDRSRNHT